MSSKIFIIIATYNGLKWLPKCLKSTKPYSVIIVDNNSSDGTVDFISNNYPDIKILSQKENIGFGRANNIGISLAYTSGADYVFLMNQDAYLKDNCLETLLKIHKRNLEYGILSPIHLNGSGSRLDQKFSQYVNYTGNLDFFSDFVLGKIKKDIYQVPFINAAGWLLSRVCIEKVGGFDPIFFHYGEDVNYCQRLKYHNLKIGVVTEAFLLHDRENRAEPEILFGTKNYFQFTEIHAKLKFADINTPLNNELNNLIIKRKKAWLKTTLKCAFKTASIFREEYSMFYRLKFEIIKSRRTNKLPNLNHLKFEDIDDQISV